MGVGRRGERAIVRLQGQFGIVGFLGLRRRSFGWRWRERTLVGYVTISSGEPTGKVSTTVVPPPVTR